MGTPSGVDREPEQLRELADEDGQRDPVQVADPDRLRQQLREQPEPQDAEGDAERAGDQRERRGEIEGRVPDRPRASGATVAAMIAASDESGPSTRIRLGPKTRVEQQRDDRRVQAGDRRQAGRLGVAHPDRDEDRGKDEPGDEVGGQPRPFVGSRDAESGDQAQDAVGHRTSRIIQAWTKRRTP